MNKNPLTRRIISVKSDIGTSFPGFEPQTPTGHQPASPTAWLPHLSGLESRTDSTLEKPPKPTYEAHSMIKLCPLRNPLSLANRSTDLSNTPVITQVIFSRVLQEFPQEQGTSNDDKSHVSKKEIKLSLSGPANDESSTLDATQDCRTLVNATSLPKGLCKRVPMADGHTYTLGLPESCPLLFLQ
ncbi:hypothetical protein DSO57_1013643 [Entomophthora muscae]|uniref:Uncharacterized protein n=1 Tax=Entomophthora muscae TaxID=34485 RepID=A0ACC2T6K3_9FUNG|nr:hypothetical protein DSO57_1013643 [Entomophthora muscae]